MIKKIPIDYFVLGIIIILIFFISLFQLTKRNDQQKINNTSNGENSNQSDTINNIQTRASTISDQPQTKEEGAVTVTIQYLPEKSASNSNIFLVVLDTHSVDLNSFDFQKDISVESDGKIFKPLQALTSGSVHHRKAEVSFAKLTPPFTLVVHNLSSVSRREFLFTK